MPANTSSNTRTRLRWAASFLLVNALLAGLIGLRYLPWMNIPDTSTAIYVGLLYVGHFGLLASVFGLPLLLAATLIRFPRALKLLGALLASLCMILLVLDTITYSLFRFHLSRFVWELAVNAGTDVFDFTWQVWLTSALVCAGLLFLQLLLAAVLWRYPLRARQLSGAFASLLLCLLIAHGWHVVADATYDSRITSLSRHLPYYHGSTAKRLMNQLGVIDQQQVRENRDLARLASQHSKGQLRYPTEPLRCTTPDKPLNILMIAIDGFRWDHLDARWMPHLSAFAQHAQVFESHYSNGNATKPGIFTLFYSLPASYWDAFTAAKLPPVIISRAQQLQYQTQILGSATLISPAFDQNVFASIPDLRLRTPGDTPWERDTRITDDWLAFTAQRDQQTHSNQQTDSAAAPFFGFLFYDTPHNHRVAPDYPVKFQPYWESVNKLELNAKFNPELIKNNYRTTLHFVDGQLQRVLEDLRQRDLLASTLILITGDHGQEFNEYGLNYWGHGSNFGDYQLRVPLVIHWPGKPAARYSYRTEHIDIAPTLMAGALGCAASDPRSYASGDILFSNPLHQWSIAHSYMNYALMIDNIKIVTYPTGKLDVMGPRLQPLNDFHVAPEVTRQVLNELSRFYH